MPEWVEPAIANAPAAGVLLVYAVYSIRLQAETHRDASREAREQILALCQRHDDQVAKLNSDFAMIVNTISVEAAAEGRDMAGSVVTENRAMLVEVRDELRSVEKALAGIRRG